MDNRPIGLLDSGVGGLTVVKKVIQEMPDEATVFIGDNAHIPYGDKTKEEIIDLTMQSVRFLLSKNVKLIIFACNTATAVAMDAIQKQIDRQIIGVVQSGSVAAARITKNKKIAVVGTKMTVALHAYQKEICARDPEIQVTELAAPKLVPLIEKNAGEKSYYLVLSETLAPLQDKEFDTLILGCTHYPIIRDEFAKCIKTGVKIIDPADQAAQYTHNVLKRNQMLCSKKAASRHEYYTTGDVKMVNELGRTVIGDPNFSAKQL